MNEVATKRDLLCAFEVVSDIHRDLQMVPTWNTFADWRTDPWDGVGVFLSDYAFEREGRSPDYAPAAVDVIRQFRAEGRPFAGDLAEATWRAFHQRILGGPNHRNNPLAPRGTAYEHNHVIHQTNGESAIAVALGVGGNLSAWTFERLRRGETPEAHRELVEINGVGPKIASFFLRDLALITGLEDVADRHLLQPVDVWVRRAAQLSLRTPAKSLTAEIVSKAIVDACRAEHLNPEKVNQGMWYFGAQVCASYDRLSKVKDSSGVLTALREHAEAFRRRSKAVDAACGRLQEGSPEPKRGDP